MTLSITMIYDSAECRVLIIIMLNAVTLNAIVLSGVAPFKEAF